MNNQSKTDAEKVREVAFEFLEENKGKEFKRSEIEVYITERVDVTRGALTGALNRTLINKGEEIGIQQLGKGYYYYDPSKKKTNKEVIVDEDLSITEQLQIIMDHAFEQAREIISSIQIVDYLDDDDLDKLARYRELLKMKDKVDEILKED